MTTTVVIEGVSTRDTKKGPIYLIAANGVEYSTFKAPLAEQAKRLVGQQAEIAYTEQQNGQYVNRYLDAVAPALGANPPTTGTATTATFAPAARGSNPAASRGAAVKVAGHIFDTLPADEQTLANLFRLADGIAGYIETGIHPVTAQAPVSPQAFGDDGIPF